LQGHQGSIESLAFAPDGKTLATGSRDTTGLVWDLRNFATSARSPAMDVNVEARWNDLAKDDATTAYDAICSLAASARTTSFLKENLRPVGPPDAERVNRLIADLDSEQFNLRKKAAEELLKAGPNVAPLLRKALGGEPSTEAR